MVPPMRLRSCGMAVLLAMLVASRGVMSALAENETADSKTHFLSTRAVVWLGATQSIPCRLAKGTDPGQPRVDHPDILELASDAPILKSDSVSFVRVRGLRAGEARLSIGDAAITIQVAAAPMRDASPPRIVTPSPDAVVWGTFTLAAETDAKGATLRLRLPDGTTLEPELDQASEISVQRPVLFTVDATKLAVGSSRLALLSDGKETDSVTLQIRRPDPASILAGDCAGKLDGPRPKRRNKEPPHVGSDAGGRFVVNASAEPAWCLPFSVKTPGQYQMMITARGDFGGGAFPSVGLVVDENERPLTSTRVPDRRWRRIALGHPIRLEAGEHVLTTLFLNDFYEPNVCDRNLYLSRYEIARVDAPASASVDSSSTMMMQGGDVMMTGSGAGTDTEAGDYANGLTGLRIAWMRPFHGAPLRGTLNIGGHCAWPSSRTTPPPVVELLVNGTSVMSQRAPDPRFVVSPGFFRAGSNTIAMRAKLDSGDTATAPELTINVPEAAAKNSRPRAFLRFSALDDAWGDGLKKILTDTQRPEGHRVALFASNGSATLKLPEAISGRFEISLDVRAEEFQGPPIASLDLSAGGTTQHLADLPVHGWWNTRRVGDFDLPKGPKNLTLSFTNDLYEAGKGDRNLWLGGVTLREVPAGTDRTPPHVSILYPSKQQETFMADAVVAEAWDEDALATTELWLDDQRVMNIEPDHFGQGTGRLVFPLLLRNAKPGAHRVKVRVTDAAGNLGESEEIVIKVPDKAPAAPGRYERAIRLLHRFAYGPETQELGSLLVMGERAWLEERLGRGFDDPSEQAALGSAETRVPKLGWQGDVSQRVVTQLLLTGNPARTHFVQWTENHFSTWVQKTEPPRKWEEHLRFCRLGAAPFPTLLQASATSPAMLVYLDQQRSFANHINENYAREVMELHTLGVDGGYTQSDVTALARLLTGWSCSEEADEKGTGYPLQSEFRYDPSLNDGTAQRFLGLDLPKTEPGHREERSRDALGILASHPSTARFISRKLVEHYVAMPAPKPLADDLAKTFMETGGDMKAVMLAMAEHPEFWKPDLAPRIMRPLEYAAHLGRCCQSDNPWMFHEYLQRSGMGVFDRSFPDGWPENDESYADSNALLQRWKLSKNMEWDLTRLIPSAMRAPARSNPDEWRQMIVDLVAVRLTGRVLSESSNREALKIMASASNDQSVWTRQITGFVANLPEAGLR